MSGGFSKFCVLYILLGAIVDTGFSQSNDPGDDDYYDDEGPLKCYFCHGMGPDNECEKFDPYKNAREENARDGPVILKTCTPPFDKSCMIETYGNNVGDVAHIRDCSDDKTFDFTEIMTNASSYSRLLGLEDNNETACAYDGQNMVCLSKCGTSQNYTDFCNGPQFDSAPSSSFSKYLLLTVVFFYVLLFP